jgi:hypothetical protein
MNKFLAHALARWFALFGVTLALGFVAVGAAAAPATITPNLYELQNASGSVSVVYSTSSFTGEPRLTYTNGSMTKSFSGDEIRVQETEIGKLVTVTVAFRPDVNFVTLSLLIPDISLGGQPVRISSRAILTTHRTPFTPLPFVGQRELYRQVILLKGIASEVAF